jgi:hypothetical protein
MFYKYNKLPVYFPADIIIDENVWFRRDRRPGGHAMAGGGTAQSTN